MSWLYIHILLPFFCAIFIPIVYKYAPRLHTGWFVLSIPFVLFVYFSRYLSSNFDNEPVIHHLAWFPSIGMNFTVAVDGLALLFALIITGMGFLVVLYSIYYLSLEREALHYFYVYLLIFMGSMLGVIFSDSVLILYVFWELTSISSFLLIAYWYQRKNSRTGAQKSLLITVFGGLAMLAGLLLLHIMTDSFSIREMIELREEIRGHALFLPAMLLILLGAFTKSVQFPFHIWLPDAMEAPTPISAYLHSATMVKAGIYLVCRFTPIFGGSMAWFWLVAGVGLITLLLGSFLAVKQKDLKALLAYSTISQLGLIMCLLGLGSAGLNPLYSAEVSLFTLATLAAIFHLFNHSIFKGCLFMIVGIVDHETGTRDIRKLGGLLSFMPLSFTLVIIAGFSMAGLPPFSGFLSKEMIFTGLLTIAGKFGGLVALFPVLVWLASVFTFIYSLILIFKTFTGQADAEILNEQPAEAPMGMLVPPLILAGLIIFIFFFPNWLAESIFTPAVYSILPHLQESGESLGIVISPWHGWTVELGMSMGIMIVGTLLYLYVHKWSGIYDVYSGKFGLNYLYERSLRELESRALKITQVYMSGSVRHYLLYIFIFIILLIGGRVLSLQIPSFNFSTQASFSKYEFILAVVMVLAAFLVIFAPNRLIAIISMGAVGYLLSLFFVIFRAPDLALTQLVVETITTVLYLLCLYYLPKFKEEFVPLRFQLTNLLISLGMGSIVILLGLAVQGERLFEPISSYFEGAYLLAGAKNMVNALLVDFRAFDTMLETIVLLIAGLGVYTLIKLRPTGRNE